MRTGAWRGAGYELGQSLTNWSEAVGRGAEALSHENHAHGD